MIDEMHLGLVATHILHHAQEDRITAEWMTTELRDHGYDYGYDEVQHGLRNLVAKGLLETDEEEYWTTEEGDEFLSEMKERASELEAEVL